MHHSIKFDELREDRDRLFDLFWGGFVSEAGDDISEGLRRVLLEATKHAFTEGFAHGMSMGFRHGAEGAAAAVTSAVHELLEGENG